LEHRFPWTKHPEFDNHYCCGQFVVGLTETRGWQWYWDFPKGDGIVISNSDNMTEEECYKEVESYMMDLFNGF